MLNTGLSDEVLAITQGASICLVTGKGGVGKSTFSRLLANLAARTSKNVLLVRLSDFTDLAPTDADASDRPATDTSPEISSNRGGYRVMNLEPKTVLIEYLIDHGLGSVASKLLSTGIINVVATAIPGIRDLLLLGKLKQLDATGDFDLIVVDLPASGHALTFLTTPAGLLEIARVGPLRTQAEDVMAMLEDHKRASCVIVTIPEETPVTESLELLDSIRTRTALKVASLAVNQILPHIGASSQPIEHFDPDAQKAWDFRQQKFSSQMQQLSRLVDKFDETVVATEIVDTPGGRPDTDQLIDSFSKVACASSIVAQSSPWPTLVTRVAWLPRSASPSADARRLAGSIVTTQARLESDASAYAIAAALVVLPTPPGPRQMTIRLFEKSWARVRPEAVTDSPIGA